MIGQTYQSTLVKLWNIFSLSNAKNNSHRFISIQDIIQKIEKNRHNELRKSGEHWGALLKLIESINETGNLHPFGRFYVKTLLTEFLIHRDQLEDYWSKNPLVLSETIRKPIIILGLPRSGTSFLFNLLAQDSNHRYLSNWETTVSQIPPKGSYSFANDPRRKKGRFLMKFQNYLAPQLKEIHEFHLDGPEECTPLLMQGFTTQALAGMFNAPAYSNWLNTANHDQTYHHHKRILQTLQGKYPGERWLLKSPDHLGSISSILKTYPDACFVHLHRDPAQSITSWASLNRVFRGIYMRHIDHNELGRQVLDRLANDMELYLNQRYLYNQDSFYDLNYQSLVKNPLNAVEEIYDYFDLELSSFARQCFSEFLNQDRKKIRAQHVYKPENFGLSSTHINARFKSYIERYLTF